MFSAVSLISAAIVAMVCTASSAKRKLDVLGGQQRGVLADQRVLGLGEDPLELVGVEGLKLDPDRKAPLHLGDEIRRPRHVEGAGGDEQNVVGADDTVPGVDVGALDDRQQIALDALAGHIRAAPAGILARTDLVDLVEKDDARLLDPFDGLGLDLGAVDELLLLLGDEDPPRLSNRHALARSCGPSCRRTCP